MKRFIAAFIGVSGIALAFASSLACAQQYTMKLSSATGGDLQIEWMNVFKKGVDARSGGRIKIEIYPSNQLGPIPRTVEGVALGTIEVTMVGSGFLVSLEPRYQVFDAIGLFDDQRHAARVMADSEIQKRMASFGAAKGVEALTTIVHSPNAIVSRKGVRTLADLKGQKIRTFSTPMQLEPFKKFGAAPIPMPLNEVLPALQNGTIDGSLAGSTIFTAFKYYDTAKTLTYLPSWYVVGAAIVNKNWMSSLPPDLQAVIREEARKTDQAVVGWGMNDIEQARKVWEQNGGQAIHFAADEQKRFIDEVGAIQASIINANPQLKADYEAFAAAAKKYRQ